MYLSENIVATFDGTIDGFFSIVYLHYYEKFRPNNIVLEHSQQILGGKYIHVFTDFDNSEKVTKGVINKIGSDVLYNIFVAFLSCEKDNYFSIYQYVIHSFKYNKSIDNQLAIDYVLIVNNMVKSVNREAHRYKGFCRFQETKDGLFYCSITPKHNVLPIISKHFSERFRNQKWLIHDKDRKLASAYDGKSFEIREVSGDLSIEFCDDEMIYQNMWRNFYKTISIHERESKRSRKTKVPLFDKFI